MTFVSSGEDSLDDEDNYPGIPFGPTDVFRVDGNGSATTLLSHGEGVIANGPSPAEPAGVSEDGTSVFFRSAETLVADQNSFETQLWRWRGGQVEAVGIDPSGDSLEGESWLGAGNTYTPAASADRPAAGFDGRFR